LHNFARSKQMTSHEAAGVYHRTVKFIRGMTDGLTKRTRRSNESLIEYFVQADAGISVLKRQLNDQLEKLLDVRLSTEFEKLCSNGRLLQRALRCTDRIFSQFFELSCDM